MKYVIYGVAGVLGAALVLVIVTALGAALSFSWNESVADMFKVRSMSLQQGTWFVALLVVVRLMLFPPKVAREKKTDPTA